ncbi:hypothetical protein [Pseudomonas sp. A-RE-19]|uniref:hypothetical protein n=1 Tax=Pseudomonas sp. A-RE-19 TaxID=2832401 RepID=UPI001CC05AF7|nr:hypothetical protein [Pseudomonas sp. A-RE-19]
MTNTTEQILSHRYSWLHPSGVTKFWMAQIIPVAFLVFALWLPYGFSLIGLIEEWGLLGLFTTSGLFFFADTSSPLAAHALRPLTIFPQALAYFLDPYSFKYWNLLLALSLCVKGSSLSYITTHLTGSLKWGVIAGLLIVIYPADTMQLSFRALHINWALSSILLGTAVFIAAKNSTTPIASYLMAGLSAILLLTACAMYEASLLLTALPFLIMFARSGIKLAISQLRQQIWKHLIWFTGALTYIVYAIYTAPLIKSYQGAIAGTNTISTIKLSLPNLFSIGLLRTTLGGWYDALQITTIEFNTYWYALSVLAIATIITLALLHKLKRTDVSASPSLMLSARLLIAGIILVLLGYAPFLLSPAHQSISQRTFLFATPGGVFATLATLIAISKINKHLATCCMAFLIFIGFSTQLYQFHHYVKLSDRQRSILKNIVERFDGDIKDKTLVIIDKTNQLNHTWMFINGNLQATLNYIYGHPFNKVEVCHALGNEWQQIDSLARKGTCEETATEWLFHYPTPVSGPGIEKGPQLEAKKLVKSQTATILVNPDEVTKVDSLRTDMLRSDQGHTGSIYRGFIDKPDYHNSLVNFTDQGSSDHYFWSFGDWWSMELPTAGSGWREADWTINKFQHKSLAWKSNKNAFLDFKFSPSADRYYLQGLFDVMASPEITTSMKIELNGVDTPLKWTDGNKFKAELVRSQLRNGMNTITFISDTDEKYYGLAGKLDWIEIKK